ncbi:mediator of RNA polymerase II transcription subunit 13-like [Osmerus eperlanus]|uniref:mediator of RNA polymerase II transcription subunit 13-like n=1 Tax=Osmerus eperlanus TaxID=29151 RepID=UPI002E0EFF75
MTTATNWVANGASLEDCHSNIFSLAELTGIKWRCYSFHGGGEHGPVISAPAQDEPVLHSFMRCVQKHLLCVWRRRIKPDRKELWIFWWGEEPNLADIIHHELEVSEEGLWECGLSYECRTLLFKAIHNLLERCLMDKDFVRIGKWFVKPYELEEKHGSSSEHLSCSFSFFLHGESNVCTSVEISQHQPVYRITGTHIRLAQTASSPVQVVLSPYGLGGALTGQAHKMSEPAVRKLMEEWSCFYPTVLRPAPPPPPPQEAPGEHAYDPQTHVAVEVIVGGVRMVYPAAFVLVAQGDLPMEPPPPPPGVPGALRDPSHCGGPLTPPTSPEQPCSADSGFVTSASSAAPTEAVVGVSLPAPLHCGKQLSSQVVQQAWRECYLTPSCSAAAKQEVSEVSWEFSAPGERTSCSCSRLKQQKPPSSATPQPGAPPAPASGPPAPPPSLPKHKTSDKPDKADKQAKRAFSTPFHHRLPACLDPDSCRGPPLGTLVPLEPPLDPSTPGCKYPKPPSAGHKVPASLLHSPVSPLPPTLSPHPRGQDSEGLDPPLALPPCPDVGGLGGSEASETALYAAPLGPREAGGGWWRGFRTPRTDQAGFSPPDLPSDRLGEYRTDAASEGLALKRLFAQSQRRFKVSEECVREHIQTLGLLPPGAEGLGGPGAEGLGGLGDDPYDFKEGDIEYSFPSSKRLKGQGRDPGRRAKGEDINGSAALPDGKDAMSIFSSAPKSNESSPDEAASKANPPLTREMDLVVNISDLDNIFDEDEDELGHSTRVLASGAEDRPPGKEGRAAVPYPSTVADLQRMFPTPPSLEQHPAFSPIMTYRDTPSQEPPAPPGGPDHPLVSLASSQLADYRMEVEEGMASPKPEDIKDFSFVYRVPGVQPQTGCSMFAPLRSLPSQRLPPVRLPEQCCYRPSWALLPKMEHYSSLSTQPPFIRDGYINAPSALLDQDYAHLSTVGGASVVLPSPATPRFSVPTPRTPRTPRGAGPPSGQGSVRQDELSSPASTASTSAPLSFLEQPAGAPWLPEAHSLYAALLLSDSVLNMFKDRNFDSCCICACNMNVKGADVDVYIPDSTREDQYRCMCGFSAIVNRRLAHGTGLFLEDELDIFGRGSEVGRAAERRLALSRRDPPMGGPRASPPVPPEVMVLLQEQSSQPFSSLSALLLPPCCARREALLQSWTADKQWVDGSDACAECYAALVQGLQYVDNPAGGKVDPAAVRSSALHPWPHHNVLDVSGLSSQDVLRMLLSLQPFLQDAIQKKRSGRTWDNIQHVQGPLTWQQFHKMAGRGSYGSEESPEPLPIPTVLLGYERDLLALSPLALPFWEKLQLEPYGGQRDVAYLVLCPDSAALLAGARAFLQDLSTVYEL